jgi:hypothetical protein
VKIDPAGDDVSAVATVIEVDVESLANGRDRLAFNKRDLTHVVRRVVAGAAAVTVADDPALDCRDSVGPFHRLAALRSDVDVDDLAHSWAVGCWLPNGRDVDAQNSGNTGYDAQPVIESFQTLFIQILSGVACKI